MKQTTTTSLFPLSKGTRKFAFILFQLTALVMLSLVLAFFITVLSAVVHASTYEMEVRRGTLQLAVSSLLALSGLIYICLPENRRTEEKPSAKDCICEHPTTTTSRNVLHN